MAGRHGQLPALVLDVVTLAAPEDAAVLTDPVAVERPNSRLLMHPQVAGPSCVGGALPPCLDPVAEGGASVGVVGDTHPVCLVGDDGGGASGDGGGAPPGDIHVA